MSESAFPSLSSLPPDEALLVEKLCTRFEDARKKGERPRIEDYRAEVPEAAWPVLLRYLQALEVDYRRRPLVILKVTAGLLKGRLFGFTSHDTFLVGRSKQAHLRLPKDDRTCSRIHFMIEVNPPCCRLVDMDSHNGTHVNGRRIAVAELKHGDKIRAGRNVLRVEVQGSAVAPGELPTLVEPAAALPGPLPPLPTAATTPPPLPPAELHHAPFTAPAPSPPATPGAAALPALGEYRLRKKLGQGGMGVVYLAEGSDGRQVALKLIRPAVRVRRREIERFLREAAILRELQHPHIVRFREMGEHAGTLYLTMDYVPGRDAAALVKRDGPLAPERAVALTCQLLEALEYAHARRFVHRDIKPGNLLVYEEGGRELVKLADFGLARVYQASKFSGLTMTGDVGGSPLFMAPEQVVNFRDSPPAADQYSAAATLYYLLTGRPTYDAPKDLYRTFAMILNEDPIPILKRRPDLPAGLAEVVHRGVRRDPKQRFADVAQMRKMLSGFL